MHAARICKPTVALVYGALGCMAVGGFGEDFVVSVAVELHGDEQSAVVLHAGASG